MNEPDALSAEQILERVRGSMVPTRADAARNFAGIEARLGLPGSGALPAGQGLGSSAALVAARGLPLSAQLAVLAAVGLVAGLVGYVIGRSGAQPRPAVNPAALVQPAAALAAQPAIAPSATSSAATSSAATSSAATSSAATSSAATSSAAAAPPGASPPALAAAQARAPASAVAKGASPRRPPARALSPAVLHPEVLQRTAPAAIAKSNALELSEALELLRRAEAAVRHSDGLEARMWLGDLERRAPREMLREERLATGVLAACALGDVAAARAALLELEQTNSESLYRARLEGSCATVARAP